MCSESAVFALRFDVDRSSLMDVELESETQKLAGMEWKLRCTYHRGRDLLQVRLICERVYKNVPTLYSALFDCELSVSRTKHPGDDKKRILRNLVESHSYFYDPVLVNVWRMGRFFRHSSTIYIHFDITIENFTVFMLDRPADNFADTLLQIVNDDESITNYYVSRSILSAHSPFFDRLFNSPHFLEGATQQFVLHDVPAWPFMLFLYIVYGIPVNLSLVYDMIERQTLELANRFLCNVAVRTICTHLCLLPKKKISRWLLDADRFQLRELTAKILEGLTRAEIYVLNERLNAMDVVSRTTRQQMVNRLMGKQKRGDH